MPPFRFAAAAAFLAALALPASAQLATEPANAPIEVEGALLLDPSLTPIGDQIDGGGLPGVFSGGGPARSDLARGPGGLRNGTGAIGTMAPSTSSSNPEPLVPTQLGVPLG